MDRQLRVDGMLVPHGAYYVEYLFYNSEKNHIHHLTLNPRKDVFPHIKGALEISPRSLDF